MSLLTIILVIFLTLLIVISGFLSGSETALTASSKPRILLKHKKGKIFNNLIEAHDYFRKFINNNDLLMIKGSNATGLNQFSKNIKRG